MVNGFSLETARERFMGPDSPNSQCRLPLLLDLSWRLTAEEAAILFIEQWSGCDDTWEYRSHVRELLREIRPPLPDWCQETELTVFRGCSKGREDGLSRTTSHDIASEFASGHRGIPVENPIVLQRTIQLTEVLFATNDREEFEVIPDVPE